jgi:hypothetical protein
LQLTRVEALADGSKVTGPAQQLAEKVAAGARCEQDDEHTVRKLESGRGKRLHVLLRSPRIAAQDSEELLSSHRHLVKMISADRPQSS